MILVVVLRLVRILVILFVSLSMILVVRIRVVILVGLSSLFLVLLRAWRLVFLLMMSRFGCLRLSRVFGTRRDVLVCGKLIVVLSGLVSRLRKLLVIVRLRRSMLFLRVSPVVRFILRIVLRMGCVI